MNNGKRAEIARNAVGNLIARSSAKQIKKLYRDMWAAKLLRKCLRCGMSKLTLQGVIERYENLVKRQERYNNFLKHIEKEPNDIEVVTYKQHKAIAEWLKELQHYKDLEEQGRLIDWRKTSEEKPDSTRHLIVACGEIISHYGYYLKPKDKWFTDWTCEKEIDAPMFWADMPEPPEESLCGDCCAKMDEVEE